MPLQDAAAVALGDFFSYAIGEASLNLEGAPYGGARHPVQSRMDGRTFANFHLDIGAGDVVIEPAEIIQCRDWLAFAQIPPPSVRLIPKEQQFAEKLHAYTLPRPGPVNSRVRDLVDMVLLIHFGALSREGVRGAIIRTFERRATHTIPSQLPEPSPEWAAPFATLARECVIPEDIGAGFSQVNQFFARP